jgi:tight adherence protein C
VIVMVVAGALAALGCLGLSVGLRTPEPTLVSIYGRLDRPIEPVVPPSNDRNTVERAGATVASWLRQGPVGATHWWTALTPYLAITGEPIERVVSRSLVLGSGGLILPPVLWAVAQAFGGTLPILGPFLLVVIAAPVGVMVPFLQLVAHGRERQHHARVVLGSFVDLVVLSLAGGVGVEGALFASSQVSGDWMAKRIARALLWARDGGLSPWVALGELGTEIGVVELVELSATLQLAGTEGARIRQSLSARAVSLRRHEQAEAESRANAVTERLFLPGALLLIGFLLFIGYPAFDRIVGGF